MQMTHDKVPPILQRAFTLPPYESETPKLLGGYCAKCKVYSFPRSKYCKVCLNPETECVLGWQGTIYSYTVVRVKPPFGLPQPYSVGYVDLADPKLRIFALLDPKGISKLRIGLRVHLKVEPLGHDGKGNPRLRPFFTPAI